MPSRKDTGIPSPISLSPPGTGGTSATVEMAVRYIDKLIGRGDLQPGASVSEPEIGNALGIGRVPVREAIRILAGEDILTLVPNRSAKVRILDTEEVVERFELLAWLSAAAIQRLVGHGDHHDVVDAIEEVGKDVAARGKAGDPAATLRAMNRFNAIIIERCGSRYLQSVAHRSRMNSYTRYVVNVMGESMICRSAPIYPRIAAAIRAGDGPRASQILLRRARMMVTETLAQSLRDNEDARAAPGMAVAPTR